MNTLMDQIKAFVREEDGASAVEYGLLVAGIAVAVMVYDHPVQLQVTSCIQRTKAIGVDVNPAAAIQAIDLDPRIRGAHAGDDVAHIAGRRVSLFP